MKPQTSFLTMTFSLFMFLFFLFSSTNCYKDDFPEKRAKPNEIREIQHDASKYTNPHVLPDPEIDWENLQGFESKISFVTAMETIDPDVNPDLKVAIKASSCIRQGQTLFVYNPLSPSLDFYDSSKFLVLWFKEKKPIKGTTILECICKGRFAVIVINKATKKGVGVAYWSARSCRVDDVSATTMLGQ